MKKSLLKSLALVGLVLSFAACDGNLPSSSSSSEDDPAVEMSIAQATEWDTEEGKLVNEGTKVKISDAVLNNKYGNGIMVQQTEGETLSGIHAVEVLTAEPVGFGWKDILDVTGIVDDIDGRPVIKEAVVTYAVDEATSKGAGQVYGYGALSRAGFDYLANRSTSGMLVWGSLVQLVTLPGTVVAGTPTEFKVVFPGEKIEANNPIALPVVIPALTAEEAEDVNEFFADINGGAEDTVPTPAVVGDAFDLCAPLYWHVDTVGFVFGPFGPALSDGFGEVTGIYEDWGDIEEIPYYFADPMPDFSKDGTDIYNYVVNDSYFEIADGFANGLLVVAYSDDADSDFEILKQRILEDTGLAWQLAEEETGYAKFVATEDEEEIGRIELENGGSYINIWLKGRLAEHGWEPAISTYEADISDYLGEAFTTALPVYDDPLAYNFVADNYFLDTYGAYLIDIYTEDTGPDYDYGAVLEAAGFVSGEDDGGDTYYYNETSGEVVYIVLDSLADYGVVELEIYLIS